MLMFSTHQPQQLHVPIGSFDVRRFGSKVRGAYEECSNNAYFQTIVMQLYKRAIFKDTGDQIICMDKWVIRMYGSVQRDGCWWHRYKSSYIMCVC